jgi:hypothetical protein
VIFQVRTRAATAEQIMRSGSFARGVADRRSGRSPQFDREDGNGHSQWAYERGRLWASIAPRDMPLRIGGKLNPKAVALFDVAYGRGLIL